MSGMDAARRDAFLKETRIAKLVTLRADGSPTVVPVWYEWDGETATVFTTRTTAKVRRILADPRVALSVEDGVGAEEAWVTIEGAASIEDEGGLALARRLIDRHYTPERAAQVWPGWAAISDQWVVIRITPKRIETLG